MTMAARKDTKKGWIVDFVFQHADGRKERVRRRSPVQTKRGAEDYERQLRREMLNPTPMRKEVPTFERWWHGRFWEEWVVARKNKPSEVESKQCIYRNHLGPRFAKKRLDEIVSGGHIPAFRAYLVRRGLSEKRINNILAPLSTALRYAAEQPVIPYAPKVGMFRIDPPEVDWLELEAYARLFEAARAEGGPWHVAVALCGEAGLRIGEVRALVWERDVDLIAGTLSISHQTRQGHTGSTKGGRRRKVPMTETLKATLKSLSGVRRGFVCRNPDGSALRDPQTMHGIRRVCRKAGLPEHGWHPLRHAFGTHAALFGVSPWRLKEWMGHKALTETLRYVHVAEDHRRPLPPAVLAAQQQESDPDQRVVAMLGARLGVAPMWHQRKLAAATTGF
jgi:integrase